MVNTLLLLVGCLGGPAPTGLGATVQTGGPQVVWDPLGLPLPEIPLPNDAATRLVPSEPTGRRLNVSLDAARTHHERTVRERFNTMDGFSTWLPISVRFDAPIDVADLAARHHDADFRDDAVFLLNVDPDCARFGEEVALDIGRGVFPVTAYSRGRRVDDPLAPGGYRVDFGGNVLFPFDDHATDNQRLFQETNEDVDVDQDGVLDVANLDDPAACDGTTPGTLAYDQCIADHLLTFYERETNTLILKPLWPMEQRCTYAVVLSNRLLGEDGRAVVSPFPLVHHADQRDPLAPVVDLLPRFGLDASDVSFAWTFTTGSMTEELEALRAGLYGEGPFAWMQDAWPVSDLHLWTRAELAAAFNQAPQPGAEDDRYLPGACAGEALSRLWSEALGEWEANLCAVEADLSTVSALFGGTFTAPDLLVDGNSRPTERYPQTQDEVWRVDVTAGTVTAGSTDVTFWCALPYEDPDTTCEAGNPDGVPFCKPFPTVLYGHGYGGSRAEVSLHMGRHTAMGVAACSLDAYGHGLNAWLDDPVAAVALATQLGPMRQVGVPELPGLMTIGRDRDLNNDGVADPGMDQWTYDIFHTRDMVRQSALEVSQLVRILRSMDGVTRDAEGHLLGDVDDDGVVDLGGPRNTVAHWGISLGGIISGVVAGSEPGLDAVSPNAGGAGLTDISVRSSQAGVPEAVILPMLGPVFAACLPTDGHDNPLPPGEAGGTDCWSGRGTAGSWRGGTLRIAAYAQDRARLSVIELGAVEGVRPGDRVCLDNLVNGELTCKRVNERGWVRLGVAADALDAITRRPVLGITDDRTGPFEVSDPSLVADLLALTVYEGDSDTARGRLDTFQSEVTFQGSRYPAGAPLAALQAGYGYERNTPDFRRLLGFAQAALGPGDPAEWGTHTFLQPLDVPYDPDHPGGHTRVLVMPTAGDANVPVNTGVHMGRVTGLFGSWLRDDARYGPEVGWRAYFDPPARLGQPVDDWLVDRYVIEGDARLQRFPDNPVVTEVIFDADDVSDGEAAFSCGPSDWSALIGENNCPDELLGQEVLFPVPRPAPGGALRLDHDRGDGTFDAFRVPLLRPGGQHGIYNAQPFRPFDADAYMVDFTVRFLATRGRDVRHEPGCDCSAAGLPAFSLGDAPRYPALGRACEASDLRVCDPTCAAGWGLRPPAPARCDLP